MGGRERVEEVKKEVGNYQGSRRKEGKWKVEEERMRRQERKEGGIGR